MPTYRATVSCRGLTAFEGANALYDVKAGFRHRPWHRVVDIQLDGVRLRVTAESDFDKDGRALLEEFSSEVFSSVRHNETRLVIELHGSVRIDAEDAPLETVADLVRSLPGLNWIDGKRRCIEIAERVSRATLDALLQHLRAGGLGFSFYDWVWDDALCFHYSPIWAPNDIWLMTATGEYRHADGVYQIPTQTLCTHLFNAINRRHLHTIDLNDDGTGRYTNLEDDQRNSAMIRRLEGDEAKFTP